MCLCTLPSLVGTGHVMGWVGIGHVLSKLGKIRKAAVSSPEQVTEEAVSGGLELGKHATWKT